MRNQVTAAFWQPGRLAMWLALATLLACGNSKGADSDAATTQPDTAADTQVSVDGATQDGLLDTLGQDVVGQETSGDASDGGDGTDNDADSAIGDITGTCPGGANCPCKVNGDCDNNICLESPDGHRCAIDCGGGACPGSFACTLINTAGGDAQYVCVPKWGRLCEPCDSSKLCSAALGNEKGACIAYGGLEGSFCGSLCAIDADCPTGYGCKDVATIEGKAAKQCARLADGDGHIQCPCDANATEQKLATTCNAAVVTGGSCPGVRSCGVGGLSACTASPSATELCDGIDNDCNGLTDDVVCDDKNICTDDACEATSQTCKHPPNSALCTDGSACTTGDTCSGGLCTAKPVSCDDQNPCTSDSCDTKLGCQHENTSIPCSDGDACTTGDACIDGSCVPAKKVDCDDKNACTADSCDTTNGSCIHAPLSGNACTDSDFCTSGDLCASGKCVGSAVNCDDQNTCTADSCDPKLGCGHTALTAGCDDGNPCTVGDNCIDSVCISGSQKDCNDQNTCTADSCDTASGACLNKPLNGAGCNDNNACTEPDACTDTVCTGKGKNCDDSNSCTSDSCDPKVGCQHSNLVGACDDSNGCTLGDVCVGAACTPGSQKSCDDNNACTGDSCDIATGECQYTPLTSACNDGNACTDLDTCANSSCIGVTKNCDDSNICTDDSCDPKLGCAHVGNAKPCDDGNACTSSDVCVTFFGISGCKGNDINATVVCDDSNACTADSCTPASGCTYTPKLGAICDDYNPCTQNDTCNAKAECVSGQNICGCQSDGDCVQTGNLCTGQLYCDKAAAPYYCKIDPKTVVKCDTTQDGQCKSTACEPGNGKCVTSNLADSKACDADGSICTVSDACLSGTCAAGAALPCDDNNPCTTDACDAKNGCTHSNNALSCTDGNACTVGDVCGGGLCIAGVAKVCKDDSSCTVDSCDSASGNCVFDTAPLENSACTDGTACTTSDICVSGVCTGTPLSCVSSTCIDRSCDPTKGCVASNNTAACSDGDACTLSDGCQNGVCVSGATKNCDDKNTCTIDSCDSGTGACINAQLKDAAPCSDGLNCTVVDACLSGVCVGAARNCDDANPCTTDSCSEDPSLKDTPCLHVKAATDTPCNDGSLCTTGDVCTSVGNNIACVGTVISFNEAPTDNPCTDDTCAAQTGVVHTAFPDLTMAGTCTGTKWCLAGECKTKGCGDGYVDAGNSEQCDDASAYGCDGCEGCQKRAAVQFSGAGSYGATSGTSPWLAIDGDLTIEAWVKPANFASAQWLVTHTAALTALQTYALGVEVTTGKLLFQHYPSTTIGQEAVKSTAGLTPAAWSHVAVVVAGQNVRFYINGLAAGASTLAYKRVAPATATFAVGQRWAGDTQYGWNGALDELHIAAAPLYGAAFTPPRRIAVTDMTRGLWHFDDASGTIATDASGTAQKPVYDLTLSGQTWLTDTCYGAVAAAGACGDGQIASSSGGFPGTEECDSTSTPGCLAPAAECQDCRYRRQISLNGSSAIVTPAFASWAPDAFCPTCSVTVEAWANATDLQNGGWLFATTCPAGFAASSFNCNGLSVFVNSSPTSGNIVYLLRDNATSGFGFYDDTHKIGVNQWHHYAVELGWGNYAPTRVYLDGTLIIEVKPSQWDTTPTPLLPVPSTFSSEALMIGGFPTTDANGTPATSLYEMGLTPNQLFAAGGWTGMMDDVRVSAGTRYGSNFVPARRGYPDAQTRLLLHADGATSTLTDDSGANVTTLNSAPAVCDDYYGAASRAKCGDGGTPAPWEWSDSGTTASNFPASGAQPSLTCGVNWQADCSAISWQSTDTVSPFLQTPSITYPTASKPASATNGTCGNSTCDKNESATLCAPDCAMASPWTWEGWVRLPSLPASGKTGTILAMDSNASAPGAGTTGGGAGGCAQLQSQAWAIQTLSDGTDASSIGPGTSSAAKQVWKAGVWQHFALEYHGDGTGSLWVDGQKARTFTVTSTAWDSQCRVRIGQREAGATQATNRISGAIASLHMANFVKYGAAFQPAWTLVSDTAATLALWDFKADTPKKCASGNTNDYCVAPNSPTSGAASGWLFDIGASPSGANTLQAFGPQCATQPQ